MTATKTFQFGKWPIVAGEIFFTSRLSLGMVNYKPVVPGHVLVIPRRVVPRYQDLTADEIADMMTSAQAIGRVVEREFGADSLTFAIQDGASAGQTVAHVHVHILPRKPHDFARNDAIYDAIEAQEKAELHRPEAVKAKKPDAPVKMDAEDNRKPRSHEEMEVEARRLRKFFEQSEPLD